jgi:glycosyltransferase involved in cell wall biosynthesis
VVHGRFHAFDLASALLQRGHDVTVFTNYPRWAVQRFGFPGDRVRSFWVHGVITRVAGKLDQKIPLPHGEEWFHKMFGRWAAAEIKKERWDVVHPWSGVSEEVLQVLVGTDTLQLVMRGSAHIGCQARLLEEEKLRTGFQQDRPSPWMIAREQREYAMADAVVVLSTYSYNTFLEQGFSREKLSLLLSGASLKQFRPAVQIINERCERISSGQPLRILNIGTFSFRKGIWDTADIVRSLDMGRYQFRFVGPIPAEASALAKSLRSSVTFVPKQPQSELSSYYAWGDIFLLPTIEDGFQSVLGQAAASGLPILTTPNGAGLDIVQQGNTGWVLPIRSPEAFIERLRWCDAHREELARMVRRIYTDFRPRDWSDVAADFEAICFQGVEAKRLRGLEARRLRG